jgi:uncharacterized protein with GYD domain
MATYVVLSNYTDQGIRNIKDAPKRIQIMKNFVEKAGGKLISTYSLMGQYDRLMIMEAPNDEAAATIVLSMGALGNTRTTTMKAWTNEEFVKIVSKL